MAHVAVAQIHFPTKIRRTTHPPTQVLQFCDSLNFCTPRAEPTRPASLRAKELGCTGRHRQKAAQVLPVVLETFCSTNVPPARSGGGFPYFLPLHISLPPSQHDRSVFLQEQCTGCRKQWPEGPWGARQDQTLCPSPLSCPAPAIPQCSPGSPPGALPSPKASTELPAALPAPALSSAASPASPQPWAVTV